MFNFSFAFSSVPDASGYLLTTTFTRYHILMDFKKILGYLDFNLTYTLNIVKTILTYILFLKPLLSPSALIKKIEPTLVILIKFKIKSYMNREWKIERGK